MGGIQAYWVNEAGSPTAKKPKLGLWEKKLEKIIATGYATKGATSTTLKCVGMADGMADMVSMARPFLADPLFVQKAAAGQADQINTCIGCNQACLDHTFGGKITSCLVNPRACHETLMVDSPAPSKERIAVVGAGPAGLAFSTEAAKRG